jgi:ABC-type glycerol-3-phosphate transport system substrate-binding protein
MIKKPDTIAGRLSDLDYIIGTLGDLMFQFQAHPLIIDWIAAAPPGETVPNPKGRLFDSLTSALVSFMLSFAKDYDAVSTNYGDGEPAGLRSIDVWIGHGREWAELCAQMAAESFTPASGVQVSFNVISSSQLNVGSAATGANALLLAIAAGDVPDVVIGMNPYSPVEFAIRGAAADLSKMEGFEAVQSRFLRNVMTPYEYNGGVYALPETMNFKALFYRTDIFGELGLAVPDTWDDLFRTTLPALYKNGMSFYYPLNFTTMLFQHGGDMYTADGKRSGLDTPQAYDAFKVYTDLFAEYGIPAAMNFYSRFRNGFTPAGIGSFNEYVQFSVAAPELRGRWAVAPMIGTRRADGTIDRSISDIASESMLIMEQSDSKEDAWAFLDWWTSADVQARFGQYVENEIGEDAKWPTANLEAFAALPWNGQDLKTILAGWESGKDMPVVLGGYFSSRHITNAWTDVIFNKILPRDALEEATKKINKELKNKQTEYGVED